MRRGLAALFVSVLGGLVLAVLALPSLAASAAPTSGDVIDSMQIEYRVTPEGVLRVKETIVYRFGPESGRHGMYRDLVTREEYVDDKSKDQRYDISNVRVSSLSGDSAEFTEETFKTNGDRDQTLRLKIGSADRVIISPTATWAIEYDVRGALRHFDDHSELYWDATGSGWDAILRAVTVRAEVPGGATRAECFAGRPGSKSPCERKSATGGAATYSQTDIQPGENLTVVAGIGAGLVRNDTPILDDPPPLLERFGLSLPGLLGSLLATAGAITAGVLYARNGSRDQRFGGMAPGTMPPYGAQAPVVKDELREDQIPVAFAPPAIPVAEGGLLIDAKADTTETAATLIDLAVRGAVRIDNSGSSQQAVLLDPARATAPHEQVLVQSLFPGLQPGTALTLERRPTGDSSMRTAHDTMIAALRHQVTARQWYVRMPRAGGGSVAGRVPCACMAMIAFWTVGAGLMGTMAAAATGELGRALAFGVPALAAIIAIGTWIRIRARGRRNPVGRAVADQLIGFRTYLATAEADQLKFEEGEDIFSRYLPWAIVFDLAERWQRICAQLVAAGRITPDPYWYTGPSYYSSGFAAGSISQTVAHTFDPPPAPAGSGGGGGSSSGFSGGSSGGGGGGGGGGSW